MSKARLPADLICPIDHIVMSLHSRNRCSLITSLRWPHSYRWSWCSSSLGSSVLLLRTVTTRLELVTSSANSATTWVHRIKPDLLGYFIPKSGKVHEITILNFDGRFCTSLGILRCNFLKVESATFGVVESWHCPVLNSSISRSTNMAGKIKGKLL